MARRSKREKTPIPVAVGIAGSGKIKKSAMKQHLSEYIEAQDSEILWVLPHSEETTRPLKNVMDFLWEESATYMLVSDGTVEDGELEDGAESVIEADEAAETSVLETLAEIEADKIALIMLLDEEDDADRDLVEGAAAKEIQTFDLCSGLLELEIRDAEDVEEPEEEADEESDAAEEEEAADADSDALSDVPEAVMELIVAGNFEDAANALQGELSKSGIKELADALGLDVPKGQWAKTTALELVKFVAASGEVEVAEVEEEPEEKPEPTKKKATKKKASSKEEQPVEESRKETGHAPVSRDVLHLLAQITMAKDTEEAKKFYEFLTESNLV